MLHIITLKELEIREAIAITGFPGMGLVGKTVADFFIRALNAEPIMRIYSTRFPAHLLIKSDALADINRIDIYHAKINGRDLIIVTSDAQPLKDEDQHELSYTIVRELKKYGVKELIAAAAFVTESIVEQRRVFVVGNNQHVIRKYTEVGAQPLNEGVVTGMNGVIVGWANVFGIDAVCLLGETWRSIVELNYIDYGAARRIIEVITQAWKFSIDTHELEEKAHEVEQEVRQTVQTYLRHAFELKEERGRGREFTYIT